MRKSRNKARFVGASNVHTFRRLDVEQYEDCTQALIEAIVLQAINDLKGRGDATPRDTQDARRWFLSYPIFIPVNVCDRIIEEYDLKNEEKWSKCNYGKKES